MRRQGVSISTIRNRFELVRTIGYPDESVHKFVLSSDDKLAVYSFPLVSEFYREEYGNISHQAVALLAGIEGPVKAAGMIRKEFDGTFVINNSSGHYLPPPENLKYVELLLAKWGRYRE